MALSESLEYRKYAGTSHSGIVFGAHRSLGCEASILAKGFIAYQLYQGRSGGLGVLERHGAATYIADKIGHSSRIGEADYWQAGIRSLECDQRKGILAGG
jgi:hypothetical protein